MKIISLALLVFLSISLYADKNWIDIEPINKSKNKSSKSNDKMKPIIKELLAGTNKKDKPISNEKNWFVLNNEEKSK